MNKIKMNKIKENEDFIFEMIFFEEIYEEEKNKIIKLSENNIKSKNGKNIYNILWNIDTWDVCFASSYGFPNNKMGFWG